MSPKRKRVLNARQRAFARELPFATPEEAMRLAGYKPHRGNAARLASDPLIVEEFERISVEAARAAGVHLGRVLIEQAKLAYSDMRNYFERVPDTTRVRFGDLLAMPSAITAAIAHVKLREDGTVEEFKLHDKAGPLRDLKKHVASDAPQKIALTDADGESSPEAADYEVARRIMHCLRQGERELVKAQAPGSEA